MSTTGGEVEFFGTIFGWVWGFLTWPLTYYGHDLLMAILSTVLVSMVVILVIVAFVWAFRWVRGRVRWYRTRQQCQHQQCGHAWTTGFGVDGNRRCNKNEPCCSACHARHGVEQLHDRADSEPRRVCSACADHGEMDKHVDEVTGVISDVCGTCGGIWLDGGEQERLLKYIRTQGFNDGYDEGHGAGAVTGALAAYAVVSAIQTGQNQH